MRKEIKITLIILVLVLVISGIITAIVIYNTPSMPYPMTYSFLKDVVTRHANGEEITKKDFKKYEVKKTYTENGFVYTDYKYNELYKLTTVTVGDKVIAIYLVNGLTGTNCNVFTDDMDYYLDTDG